MRARAKPLGVDIELVSSLHNDRAGQRHRGSPRSRPSDAGSESAGRRADRPAVAKASIRSAPLMGRRFGSTKFRNARRAGARQWEDLIGPKVSRQHPPPGSGRMFSRFSRHALIEANGPYNKAHHHHIQARRPTSFLQAHAEVRHRLFTRLGARSNSQARGSGVGPCARALDYSRVSNAVGDDWAWSRQNRDYLAKNREAVAAWYGPLSANSRTGLKCPVETEFAKEPPHRAYTGPLPVF